MRRQVLQDAPRPATQIARAKPVPAPVGGWNARDSLAAMPPTDALVLDNWIVRPGKVSVRKGQSNWCTGLPGAVESLAVYGGASMGKMFAATSTGIYDVTAGGAVGASVSAATNGRWQSVSFTNSVTQWLAMVNGTDIYRTYNGTAWTTYPTFTFGTGTKATSDFFNIATYQQRLYLLANNDLNLYYLDPGAITGTVRQFPIGQLASKGGRLVGIGTWTIDGGSGQDDLLVLATSEGEVIVYKGIDPGSDSTWQLMGVFYVGRPLGPRCFAKYGGDILYLSDRGFVPMSKVLISATVDRSPALSDKIDTAFNAVTGQLPNAFGWEIAQHTRESFLLVNVPSSPRQQFVMDFQSKAWSRFTGIEANCFAYFAGSLYYGTAGKVCKAYDGNNDFGGYIPADLRTSYNYFGNYSGLKQLGMVRPAFIATGSFSYSLSASTDFDVFGGPSSATFPASTQARWDSARWDQGRWTSDYYLQNRWSGVEAWPFFALSLGIRMQAKGILPELASLDYEISASGGIL